jgi:hypothetical protein
MREGYSVTRRPSSQGATVSPRAHARGLQDRNGQRRILGHVSPCARVIGEGNAIPDRLASPRACARIVGGYPAARASSRLGSLTSRIREGYGFASSGMSADFARMRGLQHRGYNLIPSRLAHTCEGYRRKRQASARLISSHLAPVRGSKTEPVHVGQFPRLTSRPRVIAMPRRGYLSGTCLDSCTGARVTGGSDTLLQIFQRLTSRQRARATGMPSGSSFLNPSFTSRVHARVTGKAPAPTRRVSPCACARGL